MIGKPIDGEQRVKKMENHPRAENLAALKTKYVIKLRNLELDVYKIQQFYQKLLKIFKQSFS